jgi:hypothetical protein
MDLNYTHPGSDDMRNVIYIVSGVKEEDKEDHMPVAVPVRETEVRVSYNLKGMHM